MFLELSTFVDNNQEKKKEIDFEKILTVYVFAALQKSRSYH